MANGVGASGKRGQAALGGLLLALVLLLAGVFQTAPAFANDQAKLFATSEQGYGRMILEFPARLDLPPYKLQSDNGVLAIIFDSPVDFTIPDVASALPGYITIARMDPDRKGIRFGLRSTFTVNHIEAGQQLYIDLMPSNWQGLPPSLPPEVIASLAQKAKDAAIKAEQDRKAAEARLTNPTASVRVGRNPTFTRVEFFWNVDTGGSFAFDPKTGLGSLDFDWPVPVGLAEIKANLPKELLGVDNKVTPDGSRVIFHAAEKIVPHFYAVSGRDFIIDIDTPSTVPVDPTSDAATLAKSLSVAMGQIPAGTNGWAPDEKAGGGWLDAALGNLDLPEAPITPVVSTMDSTVRVAFPFQRDTAAAVFRRGDVVWLMFDTLAGINAPPASATDQLAAFAKAFTIVPSGGMQVVRIDLSADRLATLGSEGRSWVLSLGDGLLTATEPVNLVRGTDSNGLRQMTADLGRPGQVHQFFDPVVGDTLDVVTAYPPARGIARDLDMVDFDAMRSIQGLVVRPKHDDVNVRLDQKLAVISAMGGLTISSADVLAQAASAAATVAQRSGFIDLAAMREDNPVKFDQRADELAQTAASADGHALDAARLDLARFYLANRYAIEAIGVLKVLQEDLKTDDLKGDTQVALAAADVVAYRPQDALPILNSSAFADEIDARMWRSIAEADTDDFSSALRDAQAAEPVIAAYPAWLRARFLLSAVRAAVESGDGAAAERLHDKIEFSTLDPEDVSQYQLLAGRIAEVEGRNDEALDTYGQVIAADIRPTRAEAVYRTIVILDKTGRVDPQKAVKTLAAEAMLWRGDSLEAAMDKLLAELYFRGGDYRNGFETAKQTLGVFASTPALEDLSRTAQDEFEDLYLNGRADQLDPIQALGLYYDYRSLTPPGARGDEMIRNLADRLVKVDLLSQAADLLKYQIDNRLKGAAQAQIATELAVIDIANRNPEAALEILNGTELSDLPPSLERRRKLLQAKALIDSRRNELAVDILTPVTGRDADLLRIEAYWNAKDYEDAGNLLEVMYSPTGTDTSGPTLTSSGRMDIVRAAVAFALAGDKIGLSRIRQKFSDAVSNGPEWPMFDFVTSAIAPVSDPHFANVAKAVSGLDTLDAFLKSYKSVYGNDGSVPDKASSSDGTAALPSPASTAG